MPNNQSVKKRLVSPLRYPGSKRRLIDYVKSSLLLNAITPKLYVESFAGGASIALQLLSDNLVENAILIDVDPMITGFWKSVFFDTEWLVDKISRTKVSIRNWHRYKNLKPRTTREFALKCFFLNRTSFSGILQPGAGPIGGLNQASEYKIDCRFPKNTLIRRIEDAAKHKEKIYGIWNCTWQKGMSRVKADQNQGKLSKTEAFFYFDPPFIHKADRLYQFFFSQQEHTNLRDFLTSFELPWMLSYDSAQEVEELYKNADKSIVGRTRKEKVEIIYSIANTRVPRVSNEIVLSNLPVLPSGKKLWNSKTSSSKRGAVSPSQVIVQP